MKFTNIQFTKSWINKAQNTKQCKSVVRLFVSRIASVQQFSSFKLEHQKCLYIKKIKCCSDVIICSYFKIYSTYEDIYIQCFTSSTSCIFVNIYLYEFDASCCTFHRWTGSLVEGDSIVTGWKRSIPERLNRFQARVERGPTLCETRDKCIKVFSYWTHLLCHLILMHVHFLIMWVLPCIRHLILS